MVAITWPFSTAPGLKPSEGAGRLINCYAEPMGSGGRASYAIHRVPGLLAFGTSARTGFRGAFLCQNVLYAGFSGKLEKWTSAGGASTNVGNLNGTKKGFFAQNNAATPDKIFVDPDGNIATFTAAAVTNASPDVDLPAVNSVTQLDGYFIFTTGSGQIWSSGLNATTVDPLAFTTEQTSGGLVRGVTWGGRLLAFGNKTTAVYSDAGTSPFPLARVAVIPRGIAGPYCVTGYEDNFGRGPHFVGDDNSVYRLDGLSPTKVSPPDLDGLIESVTDKTTLEMSSYISRGHGMIELSCPAWTWVLNTNTSWWHEKAQYLGTRSRVAGSIYAFDKWLTGDSASGNIVEISKTSYLDIAEPITTEVWSDPVQKFPQQIRVPSIWIDMAVGVGDATGVDPVATDPDIEVNWSDDGGQTFSTPRVCKIGRQSVGRTRVRVNQCGRSKSQGRIIKVRQSSQVHFGLMGGEMAADLKPA
jgi:hypothetical protein